MNQPCPGTGRATRGAYFTSGSNAGQGASPANGSTPGSDHGLALRPLTRRQPAADQNEERAREDPEDIMQPLARADAGDAGKMSQFLSVVYTDLHRIARARLHSGCHMRWT